MVVQPQTTKQKNLPVLLQKQDPTPQQPDIFLLHQG